MMTKWDTIQADLEPVTPRYWGNEEDLENQTLSLDELLNEQELGLELEELENE